MTTSMLSLVDFCTDYNLVLNSSIKLTKLDSLIAIILDG
jgi:hypothetical protein